MKIGVSYWMFPEGLDGKMPIKDALRQAKDLGFDSLELGIADTGVLTPRTTQRECEDIVAFARKTGIEISSLASGQSWFWSPSSSDAGTRGKILDFTRQALQVARWLGVDAYLYVPGSVDVFFLPEAEVVAYDVCYERAKAAVQSLLPTAESLGVSICVENVWNKFLLSPLEMRDFIDSFGSRRVASYFDAGNVLLTGYPDQWIDILNKRVQRVHVKDFRKSAGTVEGFVDLGQGDVDFAAVRRALAKIGYTGYVTAEVLPYQPGRLENTVKVMKQYFK
jgi:L-ribulose-5-phosphate 3-epimerase